MDIGLHLGGRLIGQKNLPAADQMRLAAQADDGIHMDGGSAEHLVDETDIDVPIQHAHVRGLARGGRELHQEGVAELDDLQPPGHGVAEGDQLHVQTVFCVRRLADVFFCLQRSEHPEKGASAPAGERGELRNGQFPMLAEQIEHVQRVRDGLQDIFVVLFVYSVHGIVHPPKHQSQSEITYEATITRFSRE